MPNKVFRGGLVVLAPAVVMILAVAAPAQGPRNRNAGQIVEYVCTNCQKVVPHQIGVPAPKQCPHCLTKFDGVQTADGRTVQRFEHPLLSNFTILGILCGLVFLAAGGAGVFFLVKVLSKPKRPRRRIRERERYENDDEDDDDRPRRRRRDS